MGMYTEIIFGAKLRDLKPVDVEMLEWMVRGSLDGHLSPLVQPEHPFFTKDRARILMHGASFYFGVSTPHAMFEYDEISDRYMLSFRSNIKNYSGEIESFLDYIKPFVVKGSGSREFYAIVCCEEQAEPTIYYLHEKE